MAGGENGPAAAAAEVAELLAAAAMPVTGYGHEGALETRNS
jgi:hypothetical protein